MFILTNSPLDEPTKWSVSIEGYISNEDPNGIRAHLSTFEGGYIQVSPGMLEFNYTY